MGWWTLFFSGGVGAVCVTVSVVRLLLLGSGVFLPRQGPCGKTWRSSVCAVGYSRAKGFLEPLGAWSRRRRPKDLPVLGAEKVVAAAGATR